MCVGFFVALALLPKDEPSAQSEDMSTLTKTKKAAARKNGRFSASKTKLPASMEISPVTGLPVIKARAGMKPITSEMIKEMLADFP